MWQLENRTPFAADRGWVRDRNGAEVWLVAVKCTFDVRGGGSTVVADEQPPVLRMPEYYGEPATSSLRYESDLVLTKRTTDIIVSGHAYAPDGRPSAEIDAGFRVGTVKKMLRVTGDRRWGPSGAPSPPVRFLKMPLVYERAFGGRDERSSHPERDWDWRNPVGRGFAVRREHLNDALLPNIEYPNDSVTNWQDRPTPAGFGPIPGHWQPRAALAGTYDNSWLETRQPLVPMDFDDRFFQSAPTDQQSPEFLRGGEPVVLYRLAPEGDVRFVLPKVFLGFETRFTDGSREVHRERRLHTVILEPDHGRVSLVWHSALPCHFKVQKLDRTVITMKRELANRVSGDDDLQELG
jgi:hypothetical protein